MKKRSLIPGWLLVVDIIMVICGLISTYVGELPKGSQEIAIILLWIPIFIVGFGIIPVILLNIIVILIRFFQNRTIVKSNKFYTGQKKPTVVATPVNNTPAMPMPPVAPASNKGEGHMELF